MSNKSSDQLFRLVHSLTKQEKRHFKIFASRHTLGDQNNYVRLFDAIERQTEYDETALKKKFRGEAFLNNFSIAKARLYDSVLRSLDVLHHQSSVDARLRKDLHCAEILYKKTLYDQCARLLSSAKKLALKYEKHAALVQIFALEKELVEKDNYSGLTEDDLQRMLDEDKLVAEKIRVFNDYWNIKSHLFMLLNKRGKVRTQAELSDFKEIIDSTLLRSKKSSDLSVNTKYLFNHIYSAYYFGIGDYDKCYDYLNRNVALIESDNSIFSEEPNIYFSVLTNTIYVGHQLRRFDEVYEHLNKLRSLPEKLDTAQNEDLEIKLFSLANSTEVMLHNTIGHFDKTVALVPAIEQGLSRFEDKLSTIRKAYLSLNIGVAYFGLAKYSQALKWINRLLNESGIGATEYIHCTAQILNLIVHIELENNDLLPYTLRSTHRYLGARNRVYKFETAFLRFVDKVVKVKSGQSLRPFYEDLYKELQELAGDQFERNAFEYFDFLSWAESKVRKLPFGEVVEERARH